MRLRPLVYRLSPKGMAFWLCWGAVGGIEELVTSLSGHRDLTLSYQVWTLAAVSPWWVRDVFIAGMGIAVSTLAVHFFGRFTNRDGQ